MVVTTPSSSVKNVKDLAGKKIGVSAINTASDAMTKSVMRANGVDFSGVKWTPIPFPDMAAALSRGDIDAAYMPEPFITNAAKSIGAVPVVDVGARPRTSRSVATPRSASSPARTRRPSRPSSAP
jgi:NitT/TauT family transport system substrate-binding protein